VKLLASRLRGGAYFTFATMTAILHSYRSPHRRSSTAIGKGSRTVSLIDIEIARHFLAVSRHGLP
jgi:hypothetical protein